MNAHVESPGLICFRVDLCVFAVVPNFAPKGNYIGSLFLQRCVELMFKQAGVGHSGPGCFPQPLNQCAGVWRVDNVAEGLKVLEAALNYLDLLQPRFTEIGFFDSREDFWRNTYPANSKGFADRHLEQVFKDDLEKRSAEFSAALRRVMEALQS